MSHAECEATGHRWVRDRVLRSAAPLVPHGAAETLVRPLGRETHTLPTVEYRLHWTFNLRFVLIGMPAFIVAFMVFSSVLLIIGAFDLDAPGLAVMGLILMALFLPVSGVLIAMPYFRLPTKIQLFEDGRVRFEGRVRKTEVDADDIRAIKPGSWSPGYLDVTTRRGKIRILTCYEGFHDFIARVKQLNPAIEIRGC